MNGSTKIADRYAEVMRVQEYGDAPPIAGVRFIELEYHRDEGGDFVELGRLNGGRLKSVPGFEVRQVSGSRLMPGAVKAFHVHLEQTDGWFVSPLERMLVGLLDTRKGSKTQDKTMRFVLGAGEARLLVIPPGVAHGAANLWREPVSLTYFTDREFDPTDERRLPYDLFGEAFWTLHKG